MKPKHVRCEPGCHGKHGDYASLSENCLVNETLPSLAFGRKACSQKWKKAPQDAYVRGWAPARQTWAAGGKVDKVIGYDAGDKDSRRAWRLKDDAHYHYLYPLREWGWDRERCVLEIQRAGLPVPIKSACFHCPSSKPAEIAQLVRDHPELADRICQIEARAKPHLIAIEGLWRRGTKGMRGATAKPGAMTTYIEALREATQQ